MKIQKYEDWMRPQVVSLFNAEYGSDMAEFDRFFQSFYEHDFQRSQGIRIVALDGEVVAGFQSFFYWPIVVKGKRILAYQSGNSLVHPEYRGKGLFGKMLNYIHLPESDMPYDLLIGFPVEASYPAFIKNKWYNPFDLQWYVKLLNPVRSVFSQPESQLAKSLGTRSPLDKQACDSLVYVEQSSAFDQYRFGYQQGHYYRYTYTKGDSSVVFELKSQRRKKMLKELVIGRVIAENTQPELLKDAMRQLIKTVKLKSSFTMLSIAINDTSDELNNLMDACGFRKIDKRIHFIAKGPEADTVNDWSNWWFFRGDIDTW